MKESQGYRGLLAAGAVILALPCAQSSLAMAAEDNPAVAEVEPAAMDALKKMGAYLRTLDRFALSAETTQDQVAETGENVEYASSVDFKVDLPSRLRVDVTSDRSERQYFYDGASFTVYAPQVGAYARLDKGPTVAATLEVAAEKYGLAIPLSDLFLWGTEDDDSELIVDAFSAGLSKVDGAECEHFVFRQPDIDWQLWVSTGETPLPCKLVITATDEESRPRYEAVLSWHLDAAIADGDFTFVPPKEAYEIAAQPADEGTGADGEDME